MRNEAVFCAALVLIGAGSLAFQAQAQTANPPPAPGKQVFVERCAKCHGEDGTKPLDSGPALADRKLSEEQILKNVRGRLKGEPDETQRAVAAYIKSLQKK